MMCYKDRAWCTSSHMCGNHACSRNYTEAEDKKNTNGSPLSMADLKTDDCGFLPLPPGESG